MKISDEITTIKVEDDFHICPNCGSTFGFHTSFLRVNAGKDNPVKSTREGYRVILICPQCGSRYDLGWRISFVEGESPVTQTITIPHNGESHLTKI
jgi:predicted RNA-binding Zn-ribbon protein involved in translation (DUF1610 family)